MEQEIPIEKKPRRNVLGSIQRRLNSGTYNKNKNLKRNMRTLREKMREFDKKGELKPFVRARYDATKGLLDRLEKFDEFGTAIPAAVAVPRKKFTVRKRLNNALNFAAAAAVAPAVAPAPAPMTLKKRRKAVNTGPYVPPEFNPPVNRVGRVQIPRGEYNRSGKFHVKGFVEPAEEPGEFKNASEFGYVPKAKNRRPKTLKATKLLTEQEFPYLEKVQHKYLPLPELYNPFTGVKYGPDNDPQPNIDSAHQMLLQIMEKAKRGARNLKRREEKKAAAGAV
jgi:hypothetical protein